MKQISLFLLIISTILCGCTKEVYRNINVSVNPTEGGSVSPSSGQVIEGSSVSFRATPKGDFIFTGWSGSLTGNDNPKTVTVTQDMNVIANFELRSYPLSITVEGEGTVAEKVVSTKSEYKSGTVVELKATPSDHWVFDHWEGDLNGNTNPAQVTITDSKTVMAVFVKKMYSLNIQIEGEGAVNEKIVETKSSYQEGTKVELTANPSQGWSFNHWEGDLESNENPAQIAVSKETSVKAVFSKNMYAYDLKIVGPGAVDEYIIETKASFAHGTKILLKAIPAPGAFFNGWSGSIDGSESEITIDVDCPNSIVATFEKIVRQYPKIDYMLPSVQQKCLFYGGNYYSLGLSNVNSYCLFDYNDDGYIDLVTSNTDWSYDGRFPIRFLLGTKDGGFIADEKNDGRMMGLNNIRKTITGDYNGDGVIDFFLIGHGYDADPFPGEYPVALLSGPNGTYSDSRYTELVSFYHGGASADFDNDGDLDIVLVDGGRGNEAILINDGDGNFTSHPELVKHELLDGFYTADLFDINKDGYVDLITGLDDANIWNPAIPFENDYNNMSIVFWGNGQSYNHDNYARLPKTPYKGMGLVLDYEFYDIDNDGVEEIFLIRTGDGIFGTNYRGWAVQIVKYSNGTFTDVTDKFLSLNDGCERDGDSIYWIDFEEIDGQVFLIGRRNPTPHKMFVLSNGKLVSVEDSSSKVRKPETGLHIYSEGSGSVEAIDYGCKDNPFSGNTCIKFSGWHMWSGFTIPLNEERANGTDLSFLKDNDYVLEFYIKNTDPSIVVHFKLNSNIEEEHSDDATFCYVFNGNEHCTDGSWERITIPLNKMDVWNTTEDFWKKIDNFNVIICSDSGPDFYLDEIRIRKTI